MRDGGPAFPVSYMSGGAAHGGAAHEGISGGMSLRDYIAVAALAGMHARDAYDEGQRTPEQRAILAYTDADALLKLREDST